MGTRTKIQEMVEWGTVSSLQVQLLFVPLIPPKVLCFLLGPDFFFLICQSKDGSLLMHNMVGAKPVEIGLSFSEDDVTLGIYTQLRCHQLTDLFIRKDAA